jgi:DNA-binding NtrC family response regulator
MDLFYRLCQLIIEVPPLRERLEDISHLAGSIRRELEKKHDRELPKLTAARTEALRGYAWPGNVRQLYNVLQKAWILDMMENLGDLIEEQKRFIDQPAGCEGKPTPAPARLLTQGYTYSPSVPSDVVPVSEIVGEYTGKALAAFGGNKTRAAEALGISVNTLNKRLEE